MRHHGAACGKGGGRLPGDHRGREIPGRDDADDAERFAAHDHFGPGKMARHAFGIEAFAFLGIPLDEGCRVVDLAAGLGKRLALFKGHQQGEILAGFEHQVVPFAQDGGARLRQHVAPGPECLFRRVDRLGGLGSVERGDEGEGSAAGRVAHLKACTVPAGNPAAADIG